MMTITAALIMEMRKRVVPTPATTDVTTVRKRIVPTTTDVTTVRKRIIPATTTVATVRKRIVPAITAVAMDVTIPATTTRRKITR